MINNPNQISRWVIGAMLALFAMIVFKNAWIGDDFYISLRTVDNFVNGHGLRWNIAERVQSFTHPLWLLLILPFYAITREAFFTVISLSILLSVFGAGCYAFKIARSHGMAILGLTILILSDAYIDYSTSGLENVLTHLLIILFFYVYFRKRESQYFILSLSLLAALGAVNRMDTLILFVPALAVIFWEKRTFVDFRKIVLGFTPLFLWEFFSLFYYGFAVPNTAPAKLSTGLGQVYFVKQGGWYLLNSLQFDPITLVAILMSIIIAVWSRDRRVYPILAGMILYVLYIFNIGGCFMAGRYLSAPLILAVIVITCSRIDLSKKAIITIVVLLSIAGFANPRSPLYSSQDENWKTYPVWHGIVDERTYFNPTHGLINYLEGGYDRPPHEWAREGVRVRKSGRKFLAHQATGMVGYYGGPQVYILDIHSLTDPLLARLPLHKSLEYRIGHFSRVIPPGYIETLESGENRIVDKELALYYDKLSFITRGDLWNTDRWLETIKINLGFYDHLLESYFSPHLINVKLSDISLKKSNGSASFAPGNFIIDENGIEIDLGETRHNRCFEISRDHNDKLRAIYFLRNDQIGDQIIPARVIPSGGMSVSLVEPDSAVVRRGYDKIRLVPIPDDGIYSIGHLRLIEEARHRDED